MKPIDAVIIQHSLCGKACSSVTYNSNMTHLTF